MLSPGPWMLMNYFALVCLFSTFSRVYIQVNACTVKHVLIHCSNDPAMRGHHVIKGRFLRTMSYLPCVEEPATKGTCHVGTLSL